MIGSEVLRYLRSKQSYVFLDRGMVGRDNETGRESLIESCVGNRVLFVKQSGYYLRPEDKLCPMKIIGEETLRRESRTRGLEEIFSLAN